MRVAISRVLADHGLPPISDEDVPDLHGPGQQGHHGRAFAKYGSTLDDTEA